MVLLVIDVQKGITDERLYGYQQFEDNLKQLIDASRKNGVEVIYVRHDDGPGSGFSKGDDAFEIYDVVAPKEDEKIFDKNVIFKGSPFEHTNLKLLVIHMKKPEGVIAFYLFVNILKSHFLLFCCRKAC